MPQNDTMIEVKTGSHTGSEHDLPVKEWQKRESYPLLRELDQWFNEPEHRDDVSVQREIAVNPESYQVDKTAEVVVACSDERLSPISYRMLFGLEREPRLVRIPGTAVGWTIGEYDQMVASLKEEGAPKIYVTSHGDCGAAKLVSPIGVDPDEYAKHIVKNLIEQGVDVEDLGHIDRDAAPTLRRIHPGLCLLIDATGQRNQESDGQLPDEQFVLTAKVYENRELLKDHIKTLAGIPLGGHGIGRVGDTRRIGFSAEHPFYLFVAANDQHDLDKNMQEAEEAIEGMPEGVMRVVGFIVPKGDKDAKH